MTSYSRHGIVITACLFFSYSSEAQVMDNIRNESIHKGLAFSTIETLLSVGNQIDSIAFLGNHSVRPFVLKHVSLLKEGDTLTEKKMRVAYERVFNLQLFNAVTISAKCYNPDPTLQTKPHSSWKKQLVAIDRLFQIKSMKQQKMLTLVIISLDERLNTIIAPRFKLLGTNISRWIANPRLDNINIGVSAIYKNAMGYTDLLGFTFGSGFNYFFNLYYYHPYLFGLNHGAGINLYYSSEQNLTTVTTESNAREEYAYSIFSGYLFYQYNFSDFSHFLASFKLTYINVPATIKKIVQLSLVSEYESSVFPTLSFSYIFEDVDLNQYPMRGFSLSSSISQYGLPLSQKTINLTKVYIDVRLYHPLLDGILTFAMRHVANLSLADDISPNHERIFFGYNLNIRGYVTRVLEGDNLLFSSFEIRYAILPMQTYPINFISIPFLTHFQMGCILTAFFDAGNIWHNPATAKSLPRLKGAQTTLDFSKWRYGYGLGFALIASYNLTLRFDFSLNADQQFEFAFSTSVPF